MKKQSVLLVNKPLGMTPFEAIKQIRKYYPRYKDTKISYAGRLDPMAEGLLLLLIGDETKKQESYTSLTKTYYFETLFGVETDSYDTLGVVVNSSSKMIVQKELENLKNHFIGRHIYPYPPFSSAVYKGKPLYYYARRGLIGSIEIPKREIEIDEFYFLGVRNIPRDILQKEISRRINLVNGEFRQEQIAEKWRDFFNRCIEDTFSIGKFRVECSSGTYVRSLCVKIGKILRTNAIAYRIVREKIGEYNLEKAVNLKE